MKKLKKNTKLSRSHLQFQNFRHFQWRSILKKISDLQITRIRHPLREHFVFVCGHLKPEGGGGVLGLIFAGYVPLASQSP